MISTIRSTYSEALSVDARTLQNRAVLAEIIRAQMPSDQACRVDDYFFDFYDGDLEAIRDIAMAVTDLVTEGAKATEATVVSYISDRYGAERADGARETLPVLMESARVWAEAEKLRVRDAARKLNAGAEDAGADLDGEYVDGADLDNLPTPEPLIDGVLNRHSGILLTGRDASYKTFIALSWALCLATGKKWLGRDVAQTNVLYVAGEGVYGLASRKKAWCYAWGVTPERGAFVVRQSAVNLYKGGPALDHLIDYVQRGEFGLVVIDTLRRASGGADGNGSDMGVVIDNIERIKRATADGSVVTIAHTTKADTDARGFSGIEDDSDIVWHAKVEAPGEVDLTLTKMKDGPDGTTIPLAVKPVLDSVILESRYAPGGIVSSQMNDSDLKVMQALTETFATTGATVAELAIVTELPRGTVYRARGRLEAEGRITIGKRGTTDLIRLAGSQGPVSPLSHFSAGGETP